jgi:hypothetical protein
MPFFGEFSMSYIDRAGKTSTQRVQGIQLTAGNIASQETESSALETATTAMSLGTFKRSSLGNINAANAPAPPTNVNANRGSKFAVTYVDSAGYYYTTQLPVADFAAATYLPNTEDVDLTIAPTAAVVNYVAAFQAYVISARQNTVAVTKIRAIGRHFGS